MWKVVPAFYLANNTEYSQLLIRQWKLMFPGWCTFCSSLVNPLGQQHLTHWPDFLCFSYKALIIRVRPMHASCTCCFHQSSDKYMLDNYQLLHYLAWISKFTICLHHRPCRILFLWYMQQYICRYCNCIIFMLLVHFEILVVWLHFEGIQVIINGDMKYGCDYMCICWILGQHLWFSVILQT